ncbi:unnamed protein product, partial [Rotaria magnacalcarata]
FISISSTANSIQQTIQFEWTEM